MHLCCICSCVYMCMYMRSLCGFSGTLLDSVPYKVSLLATPTGPYIFPFPLDPQLCYLYCVMDNNFYIPFYNRI